MLTSYTSPNYFVLNNTANLWSYISLAEEYRAQFTERRGEERGVIKACFCPGASRQVILAMLVTHTFFSELFGASSEVVPQFDEDKSIVVSLYRHVITALDPGSS